MSESIVSVIHDVAWFLGSASRFAIAGFREGYACWDRAEHQELAKKTDEILDAWAEGDEDASKS